MVYHRKDLVSQKRGLQLAENVRHIPPETAKAMGIPSNQNLTSGNEPFFLADIAGNHGGVNDHGTIRVFEFGIPKNTDKRILLHRWQLHVFECFRMWDIG